MLLRSVTVVDPASPVHRQTVDIRVREGRIAAIAPELEASPDDDIYEGKNALISPGFVDIGAYLGDPGNEEREDIASLSAAAAAGGYVTVAVLPNTVPVRQSVADMRYLGVTGGETPVDLLPLAALSQDTAGHDMTQMMELAEAGAVAFTDGPGHGATASLLKRGLEYARGFGGTIIDTPYEQLSKDGQIHEGAISVRLGLPGIPAMSESIPLRRNLSLLDYTGGRLIVHLLSTAESVTLIEAFRSGGAQLTGCTVAAHHLTFTDRELSGFDPNFKLMPPLRDEADRRQLREGLLNGTIDAIVSHHRARHREEKDLEFTYSAFGARGLETALRQLLTWADTDDKLDAVIMALTAGPRRLLSLPAVSIAVEQPAQFTLFTREGGSTIGPADLKGKTLNSPLLGRQLPGKIIATYNHGRLWTLA